MSFLLSQYLHLASFANNNINPFVLIGLCIFLTMFYTNFPQKTNWMFVIEFIFDTIFLKNSKNAKNENDNKSVTLFLTNIDICVLDDVSTHDEGSWIVISRCSISFY